MDNSDFQSLDMNNETDLKLLRKEKCNTLIYKIALSYMHLFLKLIALILILIFLAFIFSVFYVVYSEFGILGIVFFTALLLFLVSYYIVSDDF